LIVGAHFHTTTPGVITLGPADIVTYSSSVGMRLANIGFGCAADIHFYNLSQSII